MFKQQIDINIKEEKKFTSPDIDLYRPSSLIKFLVNEYPIWLVSRWLPPGNNIIEIAKATILMIIMDLGTYMYQNLFIDDLGWKTWISYVSDKDSNNYIHNFIV